MEKFVCFTLTSYSRKSKVRSDQPHKRQETGPGHSGLPLAENIKGLAMQNTCIIFMHSQARATAFFAWGQMRLFFVSLTVLNVKGRVNPGTISKPEIFVFFHHFKHEYMYPIITNINNSP